MYYTHKFPSSSEGNTPCMICGVWRDEACDWPCKPPTLKSGVQIINCTPHKLIFEDGSIVEPSGYLLQAKMEGIAEDCGKYHLVTIKVVPTEQGLEELQEIEQKFPGAIVLGSAISAQAYPGRVKMVSLTLARADVKDKICKVDEFSVYPK